MDFGSFGLKIGKLKNFGCLLWFPGFDMEALIGLQDKGGIGRRGMLKERQEKVLEKFRPWG